MNMFRTPAQWDYVYRCIVAEYKLLTMRKFNRWYRIRIL